MYRDFFSCSVTNLQTLAGLWTVFGVPRFLPCGCVFKPARPRQVYGQFSVSNTNLLDLGRCMDTFRCTFVTVHKPADLSRFMDSFRCMEKLSIHLQTLAGLWTVYKPAVLRMFIDTFLLPEQKQAELTEPHSRFTSEYPL